MDVLLRSCDKWSVMKVLYITCCYLSVTHAYGNDAAHTHTPPLPATHTTTAQQQNRQACEQYITAYTESYVKLLLTNEMDQVLLLKSTLLALHQDTASLTSASDDGDSATSSIIVLLDMAETMMNSLLLSTKHIKVAELNVSPMYCDRSSNGDDNDVENTSVCDNSEQRYTLRINIKENVPRVEYKNYDNHCSVEYSKDSQTGARYTTTQCNTSIIHTSDMHNETGMNNAMSDNNASPHNDNASSANEQTTSGSGSGSGKQWIPNTGAGESEGEAGDREVWSAVCESVVPTAATAVHTTTVRLPLVATGTANNVTGTIEFGWLSVTFDLHEIALSPCDLEKLDLGPTRTSHVLSEHHARVTHKCPAYSQCITADSAYSTPHPHTPTPTSFTSTTIYTNTTLLSEEGVAVVGASGGVYYTPSQYLVGGYTCRCQQYTIPWLYINSTLHTQYTVVEGSLLEQQYHLHHKPQSPTHTHTSHTHTRATFQCRLCYLDHSPCQQSEPPASSQTRTCTVGSAHRRLLVGCPMLVDASLRLPMICATVFTMCLVFLLIAAVFRYRKEKMIRASSPGILYITLLGVQLLYGEILVASLVPDQYTCMIRPWLRHIGFALAYGGLVFKTWRISTILHVFKARMLHTQAASLYRRIAGFVSLWAGFMLAWTLLDPVSVTVRQDELVPMCQLQPWNFVAIACEVLVLAWGTYLCYQARKAPDLYNETRQISYALWNEGLWEIFIVIARIVLFKYPDANILFVLRFLRTQFATTAMLILLYAPRFFQLFRKEREVSGTLNDVYGVKRVHRLSVMINQHGDIKTIYCVPCGPLSYLQDEEESSSSVSNDLKDTKEDEYTKAEVDSLIEMVGRLKNEKEAYQQQVKKLLKFLRQSKRTGALLPHLNSLSANRDIMDLLHSHSRNTTATTGEDGTAATPLQPPVATTPGCGGAGGGLYTPDRTNGLMDDAACRELYQSLYPGPRGSRASTMTTYISTTPDDLSPATLGGYDATLRSPHDATCYTNAAIPQPQDSLLLFDSLQSPQENGGVSVTGDVNGGAGYCMMMSDPNNRVVEMADLTPSPSAPHRQHYNHNQQNHTLPSPSSALALPNQQLRPRTLNLLDKSHLIPENEEETSYISSKRSKVKHSQSCDAIIQRPALPNEKLNFIIYI